jgi:hypothetical protein
MSYARVRSTFKITAAFTASCSNAPIVGAMRSKAASTIKLKLRPRPVKMLCLAIFTVSAANSPRTVFQTTGAPPNQDGQPDPSGQRRLLKNQARHTTDHQGKQGHGWE